MITQKASTALSRRWQLLAAMLVAMALLAFGLAFGWQQAFAAPEDASTTATEAATAESESAAAEEDAADTDSDGAATTATSTGSNGLEIGGDVFVASDQISGATLEAPANLFVAGTSLDLSKGKTGADAFIGGTDVTMDGTEVGNNLFVGGNNVTLSTLKAKNLFLGGRNLDIDAEAENALIAGDTVFLKGTYTGNVHVEATNVVVDPYLVVDGKLDITAQQEPTIASTAKIADYSFKEAKASTTPSITPSDIGSQQWLWDLAMSCLALLVTVILALVFLRTEVVDAQGRLLRERPLAILITSLLTVILLPVVAVLLLIPVFTAPFSCVLLLFMILATVFAPAFMAITLGRALMPRVNKWITSIIFVIVFAVLLSIPIVNVVVAILSVLFTVGILVQGWWVWRRDKKQPEVPTYDDGGFNDFAVPRGTHANPQQTFVDDTVAPVVPTTPAAGATGEFAPRNWND